MSATENASGGHRRTHLRAVPAGADGPEANASYYIDAQGVVWLADSYRPNDHPVAHSRDDGTLTRRTLLAVVLVAAAFDALIGFGVYTLLTLLWR